MDREQSIKFASSAAIVAAVFTTLVALLMLLNYYQMKSQDPLELESLQVLVDRLKDEPNNEELREEIRNLDLLARKAFFTNQWQVRTGRYILLFGGIVWIFAMRYYFSARAKIEEPEAPGTGENIARTISQRWIAIAAAVVLLLAFVSSFGVNDHLENYQSAVPATEAADEGIEVIKISTAEEEVSEPENQTDVEIADPGPGEETAQDVDAEIVVDPGESPDAAVSGTSSTSTVAAGQPDHSMFRGPLGNGISPHTQVPVEWDGASGKNILWKTELAKPGYNSPILWEDKLFVAGADPAGQLVWCLDRHSGKILWETAISNVPGSPASPPRVTDDTGLSAPTMCTDGSRVYVLYGTGDLAGLDMNGKVVWTKNLGVPDNHYGHSSSLLTWDGRLLIQYDSNRGGRVLSVDTRSGQIQWDKQRNTGISWASPILAQIDGKYQMVLNSAPIVAGYDISNGNELWSHDCMMGEVGPSPAFSDGIVYATNEYARLIALKPGNPVTVVWEDDEYMPEVASPVVSNGLLFIATSYGIVVCYDAKDGTKYWEDMLDYGFYSSPMIAEGKVYTIDMQGNVYIYEVSKEMNKISQARLGEKCVSTPTFADGRMYLRGDTHLFCIGSN